MVAEERLKMGPSLKNQNTNKKKPKFITSLKANLIDSCVANVWGWQRDDRGGRDNIGPK